MKMTLSLLTMRIIYFSVMAIIILCWQYNDKQKPRCIGTGKQRGLWEEWRSALLAVSPSVKLLRPSVSYLHFGLCFFRSFLTCTYACIGADMAMPPPSQPLRAAPAFRPRHRDSIRVNICRLSVFGLSCNLQNCIEHLNWSHLQPECWQRSNKPATRVSKRKTSFDIFSPNLSYTTSV